MRETYSGAGVLLDSHIEHIAISGCDKMNDHNVCTTCGFCCASYRSLMYPSSIIKRKVKKTHFSRHIDDSQEELRGEFPFFQHFFTEK